MKEDNTMSENPTVIRRSLTQPEDTAKAEEPVKASDTALTDKSAKKDEPVDVDVTDIHVSQRRSFRIDGDNDRRIYLDISDMNVITRLNEAYPKMKASAIEASDRLSGIDDSEDANILEELAKALKDIDKGMREQIDYVFDAPVSDACAPKGTMYDPYNGQFRFEHIIDVLSTLYANNLSSEFNKMKAKVSAKTAKYTKRKK